MNEKMSIEAKELLYKIVCLHSNQFYLAMEDHWSAKDYDKNTFYNNEIKRLESEYKDKYGDLPKWGNSIEVIWEMKKELKKELGC